MEKFYKCQGYLANLPIEFKCCKTLSEYTSEWEFLPFSLRHRIAEQCMACDYLMSMELWLQPKLTIQQGQKIILIQGLASIYEGVLDHILDQVIIKEKAKTPLLNVIINKEKFDSDFRTFGPILKACIAAGIINGNWSSYFGQIREVRNWIHLSNEKKGSLLTWINRQDCRDFRIKLEDFRKYIKKLLIK